LIGLEIELSESEDHSGASGVIEILDEENTRFESEELYPGIVVLADGYIPVGGCGIGTGDPYFINTNDKDPGPLYRIYHDEVIDQNYDRANAVDIVLNSYRDLLKLI